MTTTTPRYKVTKETATVVKNIVLEGVETLKADKITSTFEVKRELHPKTNKPYKIVRKVTLAETVEPMSFSLNEVTVEELAAYRRSKIPSFVLKVNGKLYYTTIPDCISFVSSGLLGIHQCAIPKHECHRLSAASDEQGGCAKVRDRSQCIERYPWITTGYETFNTKHDSFFVAKCLHYRACPPKKKLPLGDVTRAKLGIAQYVWSDVQTLDEVDKRRRKIKYIDPIDPIDPI